jgi:hypothetical protein
MPDEARRRQLAESYLDHILLALRANDRGAPFRTFFDNWYAFTTSQGHLTRGGRPIWFNNPCALRHGATLSAMHFASAEAGQVLEQARMQPAAYRLLRSEKNSAVRLMVDHCVPFGVMLDMLFSDTAGWSRERISTFLHHWYRLGVITAREDAALNAAGLKSAMPAGWDGDHFARYRHVRIA